ncbi:hypothetical protein VaNZ11_000583 [Volvox africanus]|uniref:Molecular chaperone n=1 Tax=Volvox africanus TaxID=51714 RepID=A0ABQ5RMM9_9CHLO|nr:hypothetical protein VaNZ11_000583 [Volvox africanus]
MERTRTLTHYQVLGVNQAATPEQIKQAYHAAVLKHHPDKAACSMLTPTCGPHDQSTCDNADVFPLVQRAWEVLRDASQRAAYDSLLSLKEMQTPLAYQDELDLEELDLEDHEAVGRVLTYPCRCGDKYALHEVDIAGRNSVVVPCRTCSNHVLVRTPGT